MATKTTSHMFLLLLILLQDQTWFCLSVGHGAEKTIMVKVSRFPLKIKIQNDNEQTHFPCKSFTMKLGVSRKDYQNCLGGFFFLSLLEDMLIDFRERGREGEKHRLVAFHKHPNPKRGPNPQPGHVP